MVSSAAEEVGVILEASVVVADTLTVGDTTDKLVVSPLSSETVEDAVLYDAEEVFVTELALLDATSCVEIKAEKLLIKAVDEVIEAIKAVETMLDVLNMLDAAEEVEV